MSDTAKIRAAIEQAFANVAYPGDDKIAPHPYCDDCRKLSEALKGHHWRELPELMSPAVSGQELPLLHGQAFDFYFPGFLLAAMMPEPYCIEYEAVIFAVNHGRVDGFTPDQKQATLSVLRLLGEGDHDSSGSLALAVKRLTAGTSA